MPVSKSRYEVDGNALKKKRALEYAPLLFYHEYPLDQMRSDRTIESIVGRISLSIYLDIYVYMIHDLICVDRYISLDEMTRYLMSVFKMLYEISPDMAQETGVSAQELGAVTAQQAFTDADTNGDGHLTLEEFTQVWIYIDIYIDIDR